MQYLLESLKPPFEMQRGLSNIDWIKYICTWDWLWYKSNNFSFIFSIISLNKYDLLHLSVVHSTPWRIFRTCYTYLINIRMQDNTHIISTSSSFMQSHHGYRHGPTQCTSQLTLNSTFSHLYLILCISLQVRFRLRLLQYYMIIFNKNSLQQITKHKCKQ